MTRWLGPGLIVLALGAVPAGVRGQGTCAPAPLVPGRAWTTPLDRPITLHDGTVTLREALPLITSAAAIRLSYSRDLLPMERPVCLEFDTAPVGEVLRSILHGTTVTPVVAGGEHVVLATQHQAAPTRMAGSTPRDALVLEDIVVEALSARPTEAAGVVVTEIDGRLLELQGASNLADALDGVVPGVWAWASGAGGTIAQYGSLRGASSLGLNTPKLYIDGVEVANPLLISTIDPATVERVEVIRGPQAAARFGGDALAGVTNIVTRQGSLDDSGSRATVRSGLGVAGSAFSTSSALEQDHAVSLFTGRPDRSARADISFTSLGDYVPDGASRRVSAVGAARALGERFALSATARYLSESASLRESPLLLATSPAPSPASGRDIALEQYTAGLTGTYRTDNWTHGLVAGINGYGIGGAPSFEQARNAADSALASAGSGAFRTTLRVTSATRINFAPRRNLGLTFQLEHTGLHQDGGAAVAVWSAPYTQGGNEGYYRPALFVGPLTDTPITVTPVTQPGSGYTHRSDDSESGYAHQSGYTHTDPPPAGVDEPGRERGSTGTSVRLDLGLDRLSVSAGLRLQQTTLENRATLSVLLPSFGASWQLLASRDVALALRAAYGKAVRWPEVGANTGFLRTMMLAPEVQTGTEAGVDLAFGQWLTLQATRFDQVATGLSQQVSATADTTVVNPLGTLLVAQDVGKIENRGWEFVATMRQGGLMLSSTLSLVDSRVSSLGYCYFGDLRAGDRLLGVPATTASINALFTRPGWSAGLSLARAFDWVNYDRIAIARAQAEGTPLTNAQLRQYWLDYSGSTRVRASFSRDFASRFTLRLTGDNLLNLQTGEPDNATIVPGRTISLSLRARI